MELFSLAVIEHGFPHYRLFAQVSVLLELVQASEQGGTKVKRLQWLEWWEKRLKFLAPIYQHERIY